MRDPMQKMYVVCISFRILGLYIFFGGEKLVTIFGLLYH
jgi:hypothetical protein